MFIIFFRELMDMIKSYRFLTLLLIAIMLFGFNGVYFARRIAAREEVYTEIKKGMQSEKKRIDSATAVRSLPHLTFVAEGDALNGTIGYGLMVTGEMYRATILGGSGWEDDSPWENEHMPRTQPLDWVFIVTTVFSLFALLMGFETISGERVKGTLSLTISHPVNRVKVLAGKYLSVMTALLVPLSSGMLVSLLIVHRENPTIFAGSSGGLLSMSFFVIVVYLSLFVLVGLLCSVLTRAPSIALLAGFCIWLAFVMVPELAVTVSSRISRVKPPYQIAREYSRVRQQYDVNAFYRRIYSGEFKTAAEAEAAGNKQFQDWGRMNRQLLTGYENSVTAREITARRFARISPVSLVTYALEAATGTGFAHEQKFKDSVLGFFSTFREYVRDKTGLSEVPDRIGRWGATFEGGRLTIGASLPAVTGDLDDFPVYSAYELSPRIAIDEAGFDIAGLILWNLVLAMGVMLAFSRADVR